MATKVFRLQLVSDLHLESCKEVNILDYLTPTAPYLAICGDLGYPRDANFKEFLRQAKELFEEVLYVAGNHEMYCTESIADTQRVIQAICTELGVEYLNNTSIMLYPDDNDSICIIGSTLWSYVVNSEAWAVRRTISDYRHIPEFTDVQASNALHERDVAYLRRQLPWVVSQEKFGLPNLVIVLTHHLPSLALIHPDYADCGYNSAFASDLPDLVCQADAWLCGHTHKSMDIKQGGCRLVTNPRGYGNENSTYDKAKVVELPY